MKKINKVSIKISRAIISGILLICFSAFAVVSNREPAYSDQTSTCSCTVQPAGTSCSYTVSTQLTQCKCGATCCQDTTNTPNITLTPWTGGQCNHVNATAGCATALEGTPTSGTGKVKTGDCSAG